MKKTQQEMSQAQREEQVLQNMLEELRAEVNGSTNSPSCIHRDSSGIAVEGHIGTWYVVDACEVGGKNFFLLEHETYGDEAASVIVNAYGHLMLEDVYDGFDEDVREQLAQQTTFIDTAETLAFDELGSIML